MTNHATVTYEVSHPFKATTSFRTKEDAIAYACQKAMAERCSYYVSYSSRTRKEEKGYVVGYADGLTKTWNLHERQMSSVTDWEPV